nr:hypothetical protein [uncultured Mediterranean phage uvMED]BAR25679.1 hypothetical protein [uncultured Mediterranean phage uvMED]
MAITRKEVDAMYMDLFGRTAKDAGAKYWMDEVASGKIEASDLPRHLKYAANTTEKGRAELAYGDILRQQAAEQAAEQEQLKQEAAEQLATQTTRYDAGVARQEEMLNLLREQQAGQLLAQQRLQEQISTGIQGKGGTQQQQAQPVFGDSAPTQEPAQQTAQEPAMYNDIDSGGGYYRNPYASGYGMGYQDPYAGMRFLPQRGLMGPSGFGGKGGYSQPMYSPYGYSPYGGMSPGKGGYSNTQYGGVPPGVTPTGPGYSEPITRSIEGVDMEAYYASPPVEPDPLAEPPAVVEPAEQMEAGPSGPTSNVMQTYQPMYRPMYRPMYPMYGGKGGYYR